MGIVHEEWRPVKGFEGTFEVSDAGRVKALAWSRRHWCGKDIPQPERIITQSRHSGGYAVVSLRDGRKHFVHRLVMAAFAGDPKPGQDVNHIDGNKQNNSLDNLEYCDRLGNVRHAIATGLQDNAGESNGMNKYAAEAVATALQMVHEGATQAQASRATGVHAETVRMAVKGERWKCLNKPVVTPDDWMKPAGG